MIDLSALENLAEMLAILTARYYATLLRNNVPADVAQMLAMRYQLDMMAQWFKPQKKESDDNAQNT